jgi:hypothetical protein
MTTRHQQLQQLERADGDDGQGDRKRPMSGIGKSEGEPDKHERQRMLAVLAKWGMGAEGWRAERGKADGGREQPGAQAQEVCHDDPIARFAAPAPSGSRHNRLRG